MLEVIADELPLPEVFPGRDAELEELEFKLEDELDDEPELAGDVYEGEVEDEELGEEELEDDD